LTVLTNYQFPNLRRIYASCNAIANWSEIENLLKIESLQEVSFAGNLLPNYSPQEVFNRLPKLLRVDGFSQDMLLKKMGVSNAPATIEEK
jgi:Leucine-rich repeat (LRR) protein